MIMAGSPEELDDLWDLAEAGDYYAGNAQQELRPLLRHCAPLFSFHQCQLLLT